MILGATVQKLGELWAGWASVFLFLAKNSQDSIKILVLHFGLREKYGVKWDF
jgi:hypothetical protein